MSYYVGKNLELRVRAFGLEQLQEYLTAVAAGQENWTDGIEVRPGKPDDIEQLRITVYSLLHDTGLKPIIQVRATAGQLTLWKKKGQEKADIHIPRTVPMEFGAVETEDMTSLFDEKDPLLESEDKQP